MMTKMSDGFLFLLFHIAASQTIVEVPLGEGTSCTGTSGSLSRYGLENKEIAYDLYKIYERQGVLIPERGINANKSLRMSICGDMTSESTACGTTQDRYCFEEVNLDGTCIAGIAKWEDDTATGSLIEYTALFDSTELSDETALGIRATVFDYGQVGINCVNEHSIVNYVILCAPDTNWTHMSYAENKTNCNWNVTLRSQYGCFDIVDIDKGEPTINGLSVGSVFIILFFVGMLSYCILGCAYNSFYHGRVGMEAVPNSEKWIHFCRYTQAGCQTSRDVLCCTAGPGSYQEL